MQHPNIRHEPLRRIAVTLHALADLCGYARTLPLPMLWTALWFLRPAETIARGFVIEMSRDLGVSAGQYLSLPEDPVPTCRGGNSIVAAARLANRFRLLAELVEALAAMWFVLTQERQAATDARPGSLTGQALEYNGHDRPCTRPWRPWLSYDTS